MKDLYNDLNKAKDNFTIYALKLSYGNVQDRIYNCERANNWDKIISKLRNEIINKLND